jgi:acetolactate synthase-1/2/3 large subunit
MVKVSDVITNFLIQNEIEVVFGIIGSANAHIFNSIQNSDKIKLVAVHHEQVAVMAMGAYYRSTGKQAVALVTAGGGSSNALTGVISNWADSIPGIILCGQEQSYYMEEYKDMRMYGIQGYRTTDVYLSCTKMAKTITSSNVYDLMSTAFDLTTDGRSGPVLLEIPFDVQGQMIDEKPIVSSTKKSHYLETTKKYAEIILQNLSNSKRPVIIAGHGVKLSKSEEYLLQFLEKTKIPTILTWSSIDLLHDTHESNFGRSGVQGQRSSNFIVQNSDLLIVLGSRLSLLQTGYSREEFAPNAKIIHIDIDPSETHKFSDININEDVNPILQNLLKLIDDIDIDISEWLNYCNSVRDEFPRLMPEHLQDPTNSYTFIETLSDKLDDNYTIVTDMGTALLSGFYGFKVKKNQKFFTSLGLGEMGYGIAAAVGAAFGDRPVMCLNCDGGMMMNLQELQTIKANNLPVKIVIFNNDGYLMIKHTQNMMFAGQRTCVDKNTGLELPDYKKVADAFGYEYFTTEQLDEFLKFDGHAFLEVFMDPNQEFIPKVRGIKNSDNKITPGLLEDMYPLLPLETIESVMISGINDRSKTFAR